MAQISQITNFATIPEPLRAIDLDVELQQLINTINQLDTANYKDGSVTNAKLAGGIPTSKLTVGGQVSGAGKYIPESGDIILRKGACPSGTTILTTYNDKALIAGTVAQAGTEVGTDTQTATFTGSTTGNPSNNKFLGTGSSLASGAPHQHSVTVSGSFDNRQASKYLVLCQVN